MIPPFLATLGGKIAMGVLAAALVAGAIYAYNARQQSIGEDRIKVENAEQREAQHQRVLDIEREQHAKTQSILERRIEEDKRLKIANVQAQQKIKKLESDLQRVTTFNEARHADDVPGCFTPDDITELIDNYARVLNAFPYSRAVSQDGTEPPDLVVPGPGPATCAQLKRRVEVIHERYLTVLKDHRSLTEHIQQQEAINAAFHVHGPGGTE